MDLTNIDKSSLMPHLRALIDDLESITSRIVIKREDIAEQYETPNSMLLSQYYSAVKSGRVSLYTFQSYPSKAFDYIQDWVMAGERYDNHFPSEIPIELGEYKNKYGGTLTVTTDTELPDYTVGKLNDTRIIIYNTDPDSCYERIHNYLKNSIVETRGDVNNKYNVSVLSDLEDVEDESDYRVHFRSSILGVYPLEATRECANMTEFDSIKNSLDYGETVLVKEGRSSLPEYWQCTAREETDENGKTIRYKIIERTSSNAIMEPATMYEKYENNRSSLESLRRFNRYENYYAVNITGLGNNSATYEVYKRAISWPVYPDASYIAKIKAAWNKYQEDPDNVSEEIEAILAEVGLRYGIPEDSAGRSGSKFYDIINETVYVKTITWDLVTDPDEISRIVLMYTKEISNSKDSIISYDNIVQDSDTGSYFTDYGLTKIASDGLSGAYDIIRMLNTVDGYSANGISYKYSPNNEYELREVHPIDVTNYQIVDPDTGITRNIRDIFEYDKGIVAEDVFYKFGNEIYQLDKNGVWNSIPVNSDKSIYDSPIDIYWRKIDSEEDIDRSGQIIIYSVESKADLGTISVGKQSVVGKAYGYVDNGDPESDDNGYYEYYDMRNEDEQITYYEFLIGSYDNVYSLAFRKFSWTQDDNIVDPYEYNELIKFQCESTYQRWEPVTYEIDSVIYHTWKMVPMPVNKIIKPLRVKDLDVLDSLSEADRNKLFEYYSSDIPIYVEESDVTRMDTQKQIVHLFIYDTESNTWKADNRYSPYSCGMYVYQPSMGRYIKTHTFSQSGIDIINNSRSAPIGYEDRLLEALKQWTIDTYLDPDSSPKEDFKIPRYMGEQNDYYRMLNGLPPIDKMGTQPKIDRTRVLSPSYTGPNKVIPLYSLTDKEADYARKLGLIDQWLDMYTGVSYLNYIGSNRIDISVARDAGPYEILRMGSAKNKYHETMFITNFHKAKDYILLRHNNPELFSNQQYYRSYVGLLIVLQTVLLCVSQNEEILLTHQYTDEETVRLRLQSYGLDIFDDIPLVYRKNIAKYIERLILNKGIDSIYQIIIDIFGFTNVEVFKYFYRKIYDEETGEYKLDLRQVPVSNRTFIQAILDDSNSDSYDKITKNDIYWGGYGMPIMKEDGTPVGDADEYLKDVIMSKPFNYLNSKYIALNSVFDLSRLNYYSSILLNWLLDMSSRNKNMLLNIEVADGQFSLFDIMVLLFALQARRLGSDGIIQTQVSSVAHILRYNVEGTVKIGDEEISIIDLYKNIYKKEYFEYLIKQRTGMTMNQLYVSDLSTGKTDLQNAIDAVNTDPNTSVVELKIPDEVNINTICETFMENSGTTTSPYRSLLSLRENSESAEDYTAWDQLFKALCISDINRSIFELNNKWVEVDIVPAGEPIYEVTALDDPEVEAIKADGVYVRIKGETKVTNYRYTDYARTYEEYLKVEVPDLYNVIRSVDILKPIIEEGDEPDPDAYRDYYAKLAEYYNSLLISIENYIKNDDFRKLMMEMTTDASTLTSYIRKVITVFKAFEVDLATINIIYTNKPEDFRVKIIDELAIEETTMYPDHMHFIQNLGIEETASSSDRFKIVDELVARYNVKNFNSLENLTLKVERAEKADPDHPDDESKNTYGYNFNYAHANSRIAESIKDKDGTKTDKIYSEPVEISPYEKLDIEVSKSDSGSIHLTNIEWGDISSDINSRLMILILLEDNKVKLFLFDDKEIGGSTGSTIITNYYTEKFGNDPDDGVDRHMEIISNISSKVVEFKYGDL